MNKMLVESQEIENICWPTVFIYFNEILINYFNTYVLSACCVPGCCSAWAAMSRTALALKELTFNHVTKWNFKIPSVFWVILVPDGRLGGVNIFGIILDDAFDFCTAFCNFYGEYIVSDGNHCDSPLVFSTIL